MPVLTFWRCDASFLTAVFRSADGIYQKPLAARRANEFLRTRGAVSRTSLSDIDECVIIGTNRTTTTTQTGFRRDAAQMWDMFVCWISPRGRCSLPADTLKKRFLPCYRGRNPGCQIGCCVVRQPWMTLTMAAVQLGYSTESEALSDTTMWAARHTIQMLWQGALLECRCLCLLATGMEGRTDTDWKTTRCK